MKLSRWGAGLLALAVFGGFAAGPALADPVFTPKVTVTPSADLDPAGTSITVKGTGFDPAANDGKGFGLRVGPAKDDVRARVATGFQVSRLVKANPAGTQVPLNPDGSWEFTVTVKAEYTSGGVNYSAKTQPFSVFVFGWDTPDLSWDSVTPLKFTGIGDPDPGPAGAGLSWGIKQSWRAYVTKFGGSVTPGAGATADHWPSGTSTWDSGKGTVSFGGRVTFVLEPHMIWEFTLANPKITLDGGTGKLSATINYSFYGTKTAPEKVRAPSEVDFADLTLDTPRQDGENVVVDIRAAKLTKAGADAFAGFYEAGAELDTGRLVFPGKVGNPTPPTTTPVTTTPSTPVTTPSAPACVLDTVTQGNLLWGFKKSFRQYVGSGAGNSIVASGGAEITNVDEVAGKGIPTGAYRFGFGSAQYASPAEFTVQYRGEVTFSYPAHTFTIVLGNPKLVVAQGKGTLYADVELKTPPGATPPSRNLPGVALARLDLSAAKTASGEGTVVVSGIKATLSSSDAFAGFYQPGEVLDEATVSLGADCAKLPDPGGAAPGGQAGAGQDLVPDVKFRPDNLASTGVSISPLYWGVLLLGAGAALVVAARRRVQ